MQRTIISFPRSGQHLFERILKYYCASKKIKFSYCEFYNHCNQTPCKTKRLFQKNHDFNLRLPIDSSNRYLVLYRSNMLEQLEAWFRFDLVNYWNLEHSSKVINYYNRDKRSALSDFIYKHVKWIGSSRGEYYINFIKKWVLCSDDNIFKLEYNSFLENPSIIIQAIKHLLPGIDHTNDLKIIKRFCKIEPIKKQTNVDLSFN